MKVFYAILVSALVVAAILLLGAAAGWLASTFQFSPIWYGVVLVGCCVAVAFVRGVYNVMWGGPDGTY